MEVESSHNPVASWQPLPHSFRAAAASLCGAVLLETAKFDAENFRSFLFLELEAELTAWTEQEIGAVFEAIDEHLKRGRYVAGFVSYECGAVLNGINPLRLKATEELPYIRMGVFQSPIIFNHRTGIVTGSRPADVAMEQAQPAEVYRAELQIEEKDYEQRICTIQEYLAAGHSYQVNFTNRISGAFTGTPLGLYQQVLSQQPVSFAALLSDAGRQILSFSPELFYRTQGGRISVRPMKGTWPRGRNVAEDQEARHTLRSDEKNRAEHITIVDLLRNDLGRVSELGSVVVDTLMRVERYRTLHQMTSDISGTLQSGQSASEIFRALFPSGSITGAPKRRTMQIIEKTERTARGVYTGSIGYFSPRGEACFNVAIRTLLVEKNSFVLGVGGGITADSTARAEFEECRLKASFLTARWPEFYLLETMRGEDDAIPRLDLHLGRMRDSALSFEIAFDEAAIRRDLDRCLPRGNIREARVRLSLEQNGRWSIEVSPLEVARWSGKVLLWPEPVCASNIFLQHKTSNRSLYRSALLEAQQRGFDEVLFQNEEGSVTEGAISNVFASVRGRIITPDTSCGLLPGIERGKILESHSDVKACIVDLSDLVDAEEIWLCNALRKNRSVTQIADTQGNTLWRGERESS